MNILQIINDHGTLLKKVGSTNGGEYAGPCPWCGGNDRFRVWPEHKGGRYWCRGCHRTGDKIQLIRDLEGLSYREACRSLGVAIKGNHGSAMQREEKPHFTPRTLAAPGGVWMRKAGELLETAKAALWSESGRASLFYLRERGVSAETILRAKLGLQVKTIYDRREAWGLTSETLDNGKLKKLWLPAGIVIPLIGNQGVFRLRIRRQDPGPGPRYIVVSGSAMMPMVLNPEKTPAVIVESELDALLIDQEAGDIVTACAMGSAAARPDQNAHEILIRSTLILVSLDSDGAGARESWNFWVNTYGEKVRRWPVPVGKDPTEARQAGLDLRLWIEAGLEKQ